MVKFQFFGLFFAFFGLFSANATPSLACDGHGIILEEQCNLPAPDSFRITQTGGEFIELAWKPVFPGATHQLIIMESDGAGGYVTILVENHVPGDTYIADDLLPGTGYRFVLATKCPSGDPSEIKTIFDGITLIVDLLVEARKPANPTTLEKCEFIPTDYNWVGFNIYKIDGNFNSDNYFEVKRVFQQTSSGNSQRIKILRHRIYGEIFASTLQNKKPDCFVKIWSSGGSRFRIDHKLPAGNIINVGYIDVYYNSSPASFSICPAYTDPELPWNINYVFEPMVSMKSLDPEFCEGQKPSQNRSEISSGLLVSNPISSEIIITLKDQLQEIDIKSIEIFNQIGELVIDIPINSSQSDISILTTHLVNGIYFMRINTSKGLETQKLIKISK